MAIATRIPIRRWRRLPAIRICQCRWGFVQELPVGLSFIGPAWSEQLLLACGYAFSQRLGALAPPQYLPTIETPASAAASPGGHPGPCGTGNTVQRRASERRTGRP